MTSCIFNPTCCHAAERVVLRIKGMMQRTLAYDLSLLMFFLYFPYLYSILIFKGRSRSYHILPCIKLALLCIVCTHIFGQTFRKRIYCFNFLNSIIYLFIFRNKTSYIPWCYFAGRYHYCFLELYF